MEYVVVKLGGSLISPKGKDLNKDLILDYVTTIRKFFEKKSEKVKRLVLVVGGGDTSRVYREVSLECGEDSEVDQHRIGITATWLNAELFRSLLDDICYKRVLGVGVYAENRKEGENRIADDFQSWLSSNKPVLISGGFVNGASTDFNAVLLASKIGVERIHKLTNIDYVYTCDPDKDKEAVPLKAISWDEYFRLFGDSLDTVVHKPGQHVPVDMLAARLAIENSIGCKIVNGKDSSILKDVFAGRKMKGTLIQGKSR